MSVPEKPGQSDPSATADVDSSQQTPDSDSPICYRMEPAKRMLAGEGAEEHASVCTIHHGGNGNHMPPCLLCTQQHSLIELEKITRVALMVTPQASGGVVDQAWEAISTIRAIIRQQSVPMTVTSQTVFLRSAEDEEPCKRLFQAYFGERVPATNFIVQPPCGGQALAIEAWAIGGEQVDIQFPQPDVVSVAYDGLRWIHCSGVTPPSSVADAFTQSRKTFDELAARFQAADATFNDVVRLWLYIGGITEPDQDRDIERYRELNRARTEFFAEQEAQGLLTIHRGEAAFFPASTGIGMEGRSLAISGLALQTQRDDVRLQPLENPRQTSAFDYAARFSAKSPKFSRAMAVVVGDYVTTWVSGTASIVDSESVHLGDVEKQTEQTIDNIQALISPENFERHGVQGAGAQLNDLAKIRIYLKRLEDYEKCAAVCQRRLGAVPAIYAQADVCRSNLLVEIEGVAFSSLG